MNEDGELFNAILAKEHRRVRMQQTWGEIIYLGCIAALFIAMIILMAYTPK